MHFPFRLATLFQAARLFLCLTSSMAQAGELNLAYGLGVRNEGLHWSIATDLYGTSPNIMSELTWRNLQGSEHALGLEYIDSYGWMGRADLRLADFNMGGEVQDSDYNQNNRIGEYSRSLGSTRGSAAQEVLLLIGYRFYLSEEDNFSVTPVIGLSRNIINLRMNNGVQVTPATGPFPNLDSRYRAQFSSTLAGAESRWWFSPSFGLDMKWHYHCFNYRAEADWNLRTDLLHPVSFHHDGRGIENTLELGLLARLSKGWYMELAYGWLKGSLKNGLSVTNVTSPFVQQQSTLLREVDWSSTSTSLVVQRNF